ncbi:hypothetical protein IPG36_07455 [bacterium]|nr:MAG: hypothetical protein IPG36_07455 [bacterium]
MLLSELFAGSDEDVRIDTNWREGSSGYFDSRTITQAITSWQDFLVWTCRWINEQSGQRQSGEFRLMPVAIMHDPLNRPGFMVVVGWLISVNRDDEAAEAERAIAMIHNPDRSVPNEISRIDPDKLRELTHIVGLPTQAMPVR